MLGIKVGKLQEGDKFCFIEAFKDDPESCHIKLHNNTEGKKCCTYTVSYITPYGDLREIDFDKVVYKL